MDSLVKCALAVEHFVNVVALTDSCAAGIWRLVGLLYSELDGLNGVGWVYRVMLSLIGLDKRYQCLKSCAFVAITIELARRIKDGLCHF